MTRFHKKSPWFSIFFVFMAIQTEAQIVNIESLRFLSDSNGWFGQLTAESEYKQDKVEHLKVGAGLHAAWKMNQHNILLNTTIEYEKVDATENENNFFLHLRYNYAFTDRWIGEAFFQTRYDDFLNIDQRELLGTGIRFGIIDEQSHKLFAGFTGMYEYELLTNAEVNEKIRMSDYLSFRYTRQEFSFTSTVYYQPEFADFSNFRATWSSQLAFEVLKKLGMFINYNINYDSNRPSGIPKSVTDLSGGLSLSFR
jgi:hypothetical protein